MSSDLPYKLRRIRENFQLTHAEMANELRERGATQIDAKTVSRIEQRCIEPTAETLAAYATYSGIPVSSLTDDKIQPFVQPLY